MAFQRPKKRGFDVIDLTGDDDVVTPTAPKPSKVPRTNAFLIAAPYHGGSSHFSTSSSKAPSRSQASQFRYEENGGNELVDEIDASQNYGDPSFISYELYGTMHAKIVGCRFYDGHVTTGEMVLLIREPQNPYDMNAIRVDNVRGQKIGHISKANAAKLAPFMDSRDLRVEGATTGPKDYYDCPIALNLYGSGDPIQKGVLKQKMKDSKLPLDEFLRREREEKARLKAAEKERLRVLKAAKKGGMSIPGGNGGAFASDMGDFAGGFTQSDAPSQSLEDIMRESERFNPRNFERAVERFGLKEEDLASMTMAEQPKLLQTKMLPYQLQGLHWLLQKENPVFPPTGSQEVIQLWKRNDRDPKIITNLATMFSHVNSIPDLASGGILADDMGLGKTIQVISLIAADKITDQSRSGVSGATLILAPLSVMSNWSSQMERHVKQKHALRVLTYHGPKRVPIDRNIITNYNVLITTYDTMMAEYWSGATKQAEKVPRKSGLFSVTWRRLVLDEGHIIRNPATKKAVAACNLLAQSRWILTGTPIINTLKDLFSLVKFLRLSGGLDRFELFNAALIRPVNQGSEQGSRLLQTLMRDICLRRKKEMSFIDLKLPELSEYVHKIDFLPHEQEKYDALKAEAEGTLDTYRARQGQAGAGADAMRAYRNLLEILLRLRQVCNHWKLCGAKRFELLKMGEQMVVELTPENRTALQEMLQLNIDGQDDCPVCYEPLSGACDPVITVCTHTFCYACIEKVIETQQKCPMCRAELDTTAKLLRPAVETAAQPHLDISGYESSSKIEALLTILEASQRKHDGTKTVIFSQWTSFLDIVQAQLEHQGFNYTRIDGSMPPQARDQALESLENDTGCTIMLASLSVCSVGLNLVAANQVVLADSWWAPAIEQQAVDRVYRLGQQRKTTVFRLVIRDSIEERVLQIQEDKRKLMMLAFAEKAEKRGKKGESSSVAQIERLLR